LLLPSALPATRISPFGVSTRPLAVLLSAAGGGITREREPPPGRTGNHDLAVVRQRHTGSLALDGVCDTRQNQTVLAECRVQAAVGVVTGDGDLARQKDKVERNFSTGRYLAVTVCRPDDHDLAVRLDNDAARLVRRVSGHRGAEGCQHFSTASETLIKLAVGIIAGHGKVRKQVNPGWRRGSLDPGILGRTDDHDLAVRLQRHGRGGRSHTEIAARAAKGREHRAVGAKAGVQCAICIEPCDGQFGGTRNAAGCADHDDLAVGLDGEACGIGEALGAQIETNSHLAAVAEGGVELAGAGIAGNNEARSINPGRRSGHKDVAVGLDGDCRR
jgi:hypothetical protein